MDEAPDEVVELRRYTLKPGARETLIELFDTALLEPQEQCGMAILGQFADLDDDDRFVWFRGFARVRARAAALAAFYEGPVWAAHRDRANATMIDSDDVLVLRHAPGTASLTSTLAGRADTEALASRTVVMAMIWTRSRGEGGWLLELFEARARPVLEAAGLPVVAVLVTEQAANEYPRLPVREDVDALVWLSRFDDAQTSRLRLAALRESCAGWAAVEDDLRRRGASIEAMRLAPTPRSRLR